MKVTIYNAISLDGFICGPDGEETWISEADEKSFDAICSEADVIIMGSGTFDKNPELYPVPGKENVVFTRTAAERESIPGIIYTDHEPVSFLQKYEGKSVLVAGGGTLNATLLKSNIATEVIVSVHPIILGSGTRQFEGIDQTAMTNLEKVSETDIGDGVVKIHYLVK